MRAQEMDEGAELLPHVPGTAAQHSSFQMFGLFAWKEMIQFPLIFIWEAQGRWGRGRRRVSILSFRTKIWASEGKEGAGWGAE